MSLTRENAQKDKCVLRWLYFQKWPSSEALTHSSCCLHQRVFQCLFFSFKGPVCLDWDVGHSRSRESLFKDILFWEH